MNVIVGTRAQIGMEGVGLSGTDEHGTAMCVGDDGYRNLYLFPRMLGERDVEVEAKYGYDQVLDLVSEFVLVRRCFDSQNHSRGR
jgi:hypothetical protein